MSPAGAQPASDSTACPGRIAVVTLDYPPARGGIQTLAHEVYSRLAEHVAFLLAPAHPGAAAWDASDPAPVVRARCGMSSLAARAGFALEARWRLRSLPRDVSLHFLNLYAARAAGAPALEHAYALWVHGEEILRRRPSRASQACLSGAGLIYANSRYTAAAARTLAGPRVPIEIIPLGAPPGWLRRPPSAQAADWRRRLAPNRAPLILSVGRLTRRDRYKGMDLALEAGAILRRLGADFRLAVVGEGDDRAELQSRARAAGIAGWTHWLGRVEADTLVDLYDACDLFLLYSREEAGPRGVGAEGFGIVFLEAAARGKAAVGGRSGGVTDAIADGVSGVLVNPNQPRELAEVLLRLLANPTARARLGEAGKARVEREYNWDRSAQAVWAAQRRLSSRPQP